MTQVLERELKVLAYVHESVGREGLREQQPNRIYQMIGRFPIVTFDTTAHNRLVEDGPLSEGMLAGLKSGMFFRFAGLSIEELASCPDPVKRAALFNYCGRLQAGQTDCIYPHNELMRLLVLAHFQNPESFDWKKVNVRAWEYERGIRLREFVSDEALATEQKEDQFARQKEYKQPFARLRPKLEKHPRPN